MIYSSVAEASAALAQGEITSVELTEAILKRVRASENGAYLTVAEETAKKQAEHADQIRMESPRTASPLCGIPYSLKDNIVTSGIRTTCASRILADFVPPYDAVVYERLREAGAVLIGKTDMDEFAMGSAGHYSALGCCMHPLDAARSPGGSSSGSAVSVAGGEAYFSLGSDTGGSARQPASFCGLVAMKPTYGLIPRYGLTEFASSMDTICPITRTVWDNRLVLSAVAGWDSRDMTSVQEKIAWEKAELCLKTLRVGVMQDYSMLCDADTARCTERVAALLRDAGAAVEEVCLPPPELAVDVYVTIAAAEASSNMARYDGIRYGKSAGGETFSEIVVRARREGLGEEVQRRILAGKYALSSVYNGDYYRRVTCARTEIANIFQTLLQKVDVILLPTTGSVAFPVVIDETTENQDNPNALYNSDAFTVYANLTGLPAIQLPSGGDGILPCGVSLMGKRFAEPMLYTLAAWLEKMLSVYRKNEWKEACDA